ncbi:adenylate isopentenyltransferase 3, chloroplastic-like [Telopea speciosissima]|uniref:adenylate isopentenyltransferase 3, chloroplastic-like n=1 Tax=Telopea speciosissima TaxID=54955 RepID=UPI001CC38442|nr:adenylate isopentenyltransferase 3, chloroplastic-like [Telopea speciosissima]
MAVVLQFPYVNETTEVKKRSFAFLTAVVTTAVHSIGRDEEDEAAERVFAVICAVLGLMIVCISCLRKRAGRRIKMDIKNNLHQQVKEKVIFVLGSTATGKSKLAIYLANKFQGEVINSDKIQVHKGLDIVTNKVTDEEMGGVPHHLIGVIDPEAEFTIADFCEKTLHAVTSILDRGNLPIIVGGSNRYIESLVDNETLRFRNKYECCFLWVHVNLPILKKYIYERVDQMVQSGLVDEVRDFFSLDGDYSKGIRRSIGVPELDAYFRAEAAGCENKEMLEELFKEGIDMMKSNTYDLACRQFEKINRLRLEKGWKIHLLDATEVFHKRGFQREQEWRLRVADPSMDIVCNFLYGDR